MKKAQLEAEVDRLDEVVKDQGMQILRLQAQAVLMGIALEDFKTDEDQSTTAILHGLIADHYKLKSEFHAYLREDINNNLADYR
jgi:hypothetical protein